jgi:hypothetical protein
VHVANKTLQKSANGCEANCQCHYLELHEGLELSKVHKSYDPQHYRAKVAFQPEGQESGWLPIDIGQIGKGSGIAVGLTPGDGKSTGHRLPSSRTSGCPIAKNEK